MIIMLPPTKPMKDERWEREQSRWIIHSSSSFFYFSPSWPYGVLALPSPDLHVGHVSCPLPLVTSSWWDCSASYCWLFWRPNTDNYFLPTPSTVNCVGFGCVRFLFFINFPCECWILSLFLSLCSCAFPRVSINPFANFD